MNARNFLIQDLSKHIRSDIAEVMVLMIDNRQDDDFLERFRTSVKATYDELLALHQADEIVSLTVTGEDYGNVPVAIFRPPTGKLQNNVLIWFHGGGMLAGHYLMDYYLLKHLAGNVGCTLVSVDHRLAPEHPYPAGIEDGFNVIQWLTNHGAGFNPDQFAVGGISGGGPFAVGSGLLARDAGIDICFQILLTPMLDYRSTSDSVNFSRARQGWSRDNNRYAWDAYLANLEDGPVPATASPLAAEDFSIFPPTYLSAGDVDIFRDESIEFARALTLARVPVELHILPNSPHGGEILLPNNHPIKLRMFNEYSRALYDGFVTTT